MKTIIAIIANLILLGEAAIAQGGYGEIRGLIKDTDLNPVFGAVIKVTQGRILVGGTTSDENGKYVYKPLNAGSYEVIVTSQEHRMTKKTGVEVEPEKAAYVDFKLKINTIEGDIVIEAEPYEKPLLDLSMYNITSLNAEDFANSASYGGSVVDMISSQSSALVEDSQGEWHMRGGRSDATEYIIDGMRVMSMSGLPNSSVENVTMITGGIPAMYGDLTNGVIVVTTKDYFGGMRAKNIYQTQARERYEYKQRIKKERAEEALRKKEIENEVNH
jgi:hypothetical protein